MSEPIVPSVISMGARPSFWSLSRTPTKVSCAVSSPPRRSMDSFFSLRICSSTRCILSRHATPLRGPVASICMILDDGNRSATDSPDVCRTAMWKASRYPSWCLLRLPTHSLMMVS